MGQPYRHEVRIRYGEVDMQGHVFNAHYLAFVDDALEQWLLARLGEGYTDGFDMVVKRAVMTWSSGARHSELLAIDVMATRWGRTSFDVRYAASVEERPIFEATLTYISVAPGAMTPAPVPEHVRAALA